MSRPPALLAPRPELHSTSLRLVSPRRQPRRIAVLLAPLLLAAAALAADAAAGRVEARNADLVAVGLVHGGRMTVRLSRALDNAPVTDAVLGVAFRGALHPARVETDGGYTFESDDLKLAGDAAVEFRVTRNGAEEILKGTLAGGGVPADKRSNARQLWWWVLNFGVCLGFLYLWSRRKSKASD